MEVSVRATEEDSMNVHGPEDPDNEDLENGAGGDDSGGDGTGEAGEGGDEDAGGGDDADLAGDTNGE